MRYENCVNCGYPEGLHHGDTMQCPKGGEAPIGKKQEWLSTVYVPDNISQIESLEKRVRLLESRLDKLERKED